MKNIICLFTFLLLLISGCKQTQPENIITVEDLRETGPGQRRDISLPFSRIVLNPFNFRASVFSTASDVSNRSYLPLNVGYLSTEKINERKMDDLLFLFHYKPIEGNVRMTQGWSADLKKKESWATEKYTRLDMLSRGLKYSVDNNADVAYKVLRPKERFMVDIQKTPYLNIFIPEATGQWSLKIKNSKDEEVTLRADATGSGVFEYDLNNLTNWTGVQNIGLDIWCIGKGSSMNINHIYFVGTSDELPGEEPVSFSTEWMPHELPFSAHYANGDKLKGTDFLYDKNTIIREIHFDQDNKNNTYILGGRYFGSELQKVNNTLLINNGIFAYGIQLKDIPFSEVNYYRSLLDLRSQSNTCNVEDGLYWSIRLDKNQIKNNELITAVAFSYKNDRENPQLLEERLKSSLVDNNYQLKYREQKEYWNDFLKKVPHPSDFTIKTIDSKGVSPEEIKKTYYKAWIHVASDVLEADPLHFEYPQVVAGKASMWDESDERAPYSATWESFFGIQLYAFIDPQTAWDAFEGIMSLTDAEGVIGGESLPSRKAQTAWILYQITKDKVRLEKVYSALERYLDWRLIYPHWIYNSSADKTKKDAEFAFSAIIDIDYMMKISQVIKDQPTVDEWKKKKEDFFKSCLPWFWETPESLPVQYYDTGTGVRSAGHGYWVTTGLHIDLIEGTYLETMLKRFTSSFNPDESFGGKDIGAPKYPDISYTVYGLFDKDYPSEAEEVIEVCIRDIVRSGNWFAESYQASNPPHPEGVRPSLFGACTIIDFVMMKNGFRYDEGSPLILNTFSGQRSIKGIRFNGKILNISSDENGVFKVSGDYLDKPQNLDINYGEYKPIINAN